MLRRRATTIMVFGLIRPTATCVAVLLLARPVLAQELDDAEVAAKSSTVAMLENPFSDHPLTSKEIEDAILVAHGMVSAKVSNGTPNSSDWPGWFEGTNNCGSSGTLAAEDMGDPAVSFITPYAQYRNEYVFLTPYTYAWDVLTITAPDWAWDTVLVDGLPLPAPTPVAGTEDLAYARFLVADGPHHVESSMVGVGIEVHGYDCRLSYAYAGGLSLGAINEPPPPPDEVIDP